MNVIEICEQVIGIPYAHEHNKVIHGSLEFVCTDKINQSVHLEKLSLSVEKWRHELKQRCRFFFGEILIDKNISLITLENVNEQDREYARNNGYSIKLVAFAIILEGTIYGMIMPRYLTDDDPLQRISQNQTLIQTNDSDTQFYSTVEWQATGALVTSLNSNFPIEKTNLTLQQACVEVFISFNSLDGFSFEDLDEVESGFSSSSYHYVIGKIRLNRFQNWAERPGFSIIRLNSALHIAREKKTSKGTN